MKRSLVLLIISLFWISSCIQPVRCEQTSFMDGTNDVYIVNSIAGYYSNSSKIDLPYLDVVNITVDSPGLLIIRINGSLMSLTGKHLIWYINMTIDEDTVINLRAGYFDGGVSGYYSVFTNGVLTLYAGLYGDTESDAYGVNVHDTNSLLTPQNLTCQSFMDLENGTFYADFYPDSVFLLTNETENETTTEPEILPVGLSITVIAGISVIGIGFIGFYVYIYLTSCDRPNNKNKAKCLKRK